MISNKVRDNRRSKFMKMPKNIQRLYREGKCKECSVVVTQMDFAKILGKFTKVKVQYEVSSTKTKKNVKEASPNARLKKSENGMVLLNRNAYIEHPIKGLLDSGKSKSSATRRITSRDNNNVTSYKSNNILKENNKFKKTAKSLNNNRTNAVSSKQFAIVFDIPEIKNLDDHVNKMSLAELLPLINKDVLPSDAWCIDYFPKDEEPKDDKVYDRIAAELEDLMYKEKPKEKDVKSDEFPSIMDILNEDSVNKPDDQGPNSNLESSDVEAMLLGKSKDSSLSQPTPMEVENSEVNSLIADVVQLVEPSKPSETTQIDLNPNSPSILEEALQKGNLPVNTSITEDNVLEDSTTDTKKINEKDAPLVQSKPPVTHVIFKKSVNGKCSKSVTCPKSLKYSIELLGKSVELLGAPKFISSIEDLQVLLQIVDESNLDSLYILH